jgi:glycosyltransferase involved in cell wall biosynthesis
MAGLIVHEWFEQFGGAEKVVEEMAATFPDASISCLWDDYPARFAGRTVRESWLARTPLRKHKSLAVPFMLPTWRYLSTEHKPDWLLCSSHLFAHHAKLRHYDVPKYVYAYTPARYIWTPELDQRGNTPLARAVSKPLQKLDRARAQEATSIACVSNFVRARIQDSWQRTCEVIYPPVDVEYFNASREHELTEAEIDVLEALPHTFVMGASRFIPYKRLDLVIEFGIANDIPVVLAGGGPEEKQLRAMAASAPVPVTFVGRPSPALLRELYARAMAYIFPPVEDFGIMPIEAAATGTPVVANALGGAAETVMDGETGVLLEGFSRHEMQSAATTVSGLAPALCRYRATGFSPTSFRSRVEQWLTADGALTYNP